jgi:hypothetical protein
MDWIWRNIFRYLFMVVPNYHKLTIFLELENHYDKIYLEKLTDKFNQLNSFVKEHERRK